MVYVRAALIVCIQAPVYFAISVAATPFLALAIVAKEAVAAISGEEST